MVCWGEVFDNRFTEKIKPPFVEFANFQGINAPTKAKPPTGQH